MDSNQKHFYKGCWVEQSSGILRWTVLKSVYTGWCRGAVFMYTAVDCTEGCFIEILGGSSLQVKCGGLY